MVLSQDQDQRSSFECPQCWDLPQIDRDHERVQQRFEDLLHVSSGPWDAVVLHLLKMYLYWKEGQFGKSMHHLAEIGRLISAVESDGVKGDLVLRNRKAIEHIVEACYLYLPKNPDAKPDNLVQFRHLDRTQQAAVWGIRAACLYYSGQSCYYASQESARWAAELMPEEPEWRCIMGGPTNAEKAVLLGRTPLTVLDAALGAIVQGQGSLATKLLNEALLLWPESSYVQLRCATLSAASRTFGDDNPAKDLSIARKCSEQLIQLAPDCVLAHIVRRFIDPEHNSPKIQDCQRIYGLTLIHAFQK